MLEEESANLRRLTRILGELETVSGTISVNAGTIQEFVHFEVGHVTARFE